MLVVTRGHGDRVFINGQQIKVTILGIRGNQVRLGFEAPKNVSIHREEVYLRIQSEHEETALT